ncbi:hypothetical protein WJX81_002390 [Elliptochloris bilobata]|uniref:Peptidase S54 rhomboid domain-containing protein n=1 Tax=Elliptochloris bilobata TaxID=381761 RepID=A0AAW1SKG1_9CHLO
MDTLSRLLGGLEGSESAAGPTGEPVGDVRAQWEAAQAQGAPPRRQGTEAGNAGRFLDVDEVQAGGGDPRTGRQTALDEALDIPTVQPRLCYVVLAMNLAVYAAGIGIAVAQGNDASNDFFLALAKVNDSVVAGEYYRLLTATALHAGLLHLGLNCAALASVGPQAEAVLGYAGFATVYLLAGLAGSGASLLASDAVTVGASGAIFGLLGALGGYFLRNPKLQGSGRQALYIAGVAALNIALGATQGSLIDNSGHLGGLAVGVALGLTIGPRWVVRRELDIPPGALAVPDDAREVAVVVDATPAWQRAAAAIVAGALVLGVIMAGVLLRSQVEKGRTGSGACEKP